MKIATLHVLCEGYGRRYDMAYDNFNIDPRPSVLALGRWVNHKGTKLLCGVNLNYLSDDQVLELQKNLQVILSDRNLRRRVRRLRSTMPQIFDRAYRTYNQEHVRIISPGTLKFFREPVPQAIKEPTTKAVELKPDIGKISGVKSKIKDKDDLKNKGLEEPKKPEDVKDVDNIKNDKLELDVDREEPDRNGKKLLSKPEKTDKKDLTKPVDKEDPENVEKDNKFGKSDVTEIKPEDLDFEEGEEEQDSGIPSK